LWSGDNQTLCRAGLISTNENIEGLDWHGLCGAFRTVFVSAVRGLMHIDLGNSHGARLSGIALAALLALIGVSIAPLARQAHAEVQRPPPLPPSETTPPGEIELGVYGGKSHVEIHPYVDKACCGDSDCFVSKLRFVRGNPYQYEAYFQEADGSCPRWCTVWFGVTRRQALPNGLSAVCSLPPPKCGCPRSDQFYCIYPGDGG
jgi:hypothetical protein